MRDLIFPELEEKAFSETIEKIKKRDFYLSKSKIASLVSPLSFSRNVFDRKPLVSESIDIGSVVDCLITENDRFDELFIVSDISVSSGNQTNVVKEALDAKKVDDDGNEISVEDRFEQAFYNNYKRGKPEDYLFLLDYIKIFESGKRCISTEIYDQARRLADNLLSQPEIIRILEEAEFQKKLDFEHMGWKFRGIMDIQTPRSVFDFKFSSRLDPDNFTREILKYRYDLQGAIYTLGTYYEAGHYPDFHLIVFDKDFEYDILTVGNDFVDYGIQTINHGIEKLEWMIKNDNWFGSYGAGRKHRKVITAPRWLPGFEEIE